MKTQKTCLPSATGLALALIAFGCVLSFQSPAARFATTAADAARQSDFSRANLLCVPSLKAHVNSSR